MTACPGTSGPVWLRLPDEEMTAERVRVLIAEVSEPLC